MKKLIIFSIFILMSIAGNELLSQQTVYCEDGVTAASSVTLDFGTSGSSGCQTGTVIVYYCCDNSTGTPVIDIRAAHIMDYRCWENEDFSSQSFWDKLFDKLLTELANNPNLACSFSNVGSCDNPPLQTVTDVQISTCWKLQNDPLNGYVELLPCDEAGDCEKTFEICFNYSTNPPTLQKNLVSSQETYNVLCAEEVLNFDPKDVIIDENGKITVELTTPCTYSCY